MKKNIFILFIVAFIISFVLVKYFSIGICILSKSHLSSESSIDSEYQKKEISKDSRIYDSNYTSFNL